MTSPPLVLIAEHNQDVREMLVTSLRLAGLHAAEAKTCTVARALASALLPACVLAELTLPHAGALELLRELRGDPRTHTVPVAVMTTDTRMEFDLWEAGFDLVLLKPFAGVDIAGRLITLRAGDLAGAEVSPQAP